MTTLQQLISGCKASVLISVNEHINDHRSIAEYITDARSYQSDLPSAAMEAEMIARNTVVEIQFYPRTPICFYKVWHWDVELGLIEALSLLNSDKG